MGIFSDIGQAMMNDAIVPSEPKKPSDELVPTPPPFKGEMLPFEGEAPPFDGEVIEVGEDIIPVVVNYVYSSPLRTIHPIDGQSSESESVANSEIQTDTGELEEALNRTTPNVHTEATVDASVVSTSIVFEGETEIRGNIKGNITAKKSLCIHGTVTGNVSAISLTLYGTIFGSVSCNTLTLLSDKKCMSQVKGSIRTDALFTEFS